MDPKTTAAIALAEAVHEHALADAAYVDDYPAGTEEERLATLRKAHIVLVSRLKEYRRTRDLAPDPREALVARVVETALAEANASIAWEAARGQGEDEARQKIWWEAHCAQFGAGRLLAEYDAAERAKAGK